MMDCSVAIIGAGVIGLAVASEIGGGDVFLIEKDEAHGRGISSRNSEVIHAGIYYPPGSLKGRLCVEGSRMLYEICQRNKIAHRRTGKLIIAVSREEETVLQQLFENARRNGISSLQLLDRKKTLEMEPHINASASIYSPDTGILTAHGLMEYYLQKAKSKGTDIVYGTAVVAIEKITGGYKICTRNNGGEYFELLSEYVINAAGLAADTIAQMVGSEYRLHYCKGEYFGIENVKKGIVRRLVYPVPEEKHVGLGVHLTLDLNGRMKLGPDATYIDRVEDYRVDESKKDRFYQGAVRFLPFLRPENIVPDMAGIRPKLQGAGEEFRDFVISEDLPGFINLVGIESPGLTASPAIGNYVRTLMRGN